MDTSCRKRFHDPDFSILSILFIMSILSKNPHPRIFTTESRRARSPEGAIPILLILSILSKNPGPLRAFSRVGNHRQKVNACRFLKPWPHEEKRRRNTSKSERAVSYIDGLARISHRKKRPAGAFARRRCPQTQRQPLGLSRSVSSTYLVDTPPGPPRPRRISDLCVLA